MLELLFEVPFTQNGIKNLGNTSSLILHTQYDAGNHRDLLPCTETQDFVFAVKFRKFSGVIARRLRTGKSSGDSPQASP